MQKNPKNPAWKNYLREIGLNGYELVSRLGNPVKIHKKGEPYNLKTVKIIYFAHKTKRRRREDPNDGFSKNQLKGIKFYSDLGFDVTRLRC